MSLRVALVGPATPAEFSPMFGSADAAVISKTRGLGGAPINALARALIARGIQVDLITLDPEVTEPVVVTSDSLKILVGPYRPRARDRAADFFRAERRSIGRLLEASSAEVLHAQWTYEFALAALHTRRPCLVTAHDAPFTVLRLMPDPYRAVRTLMAARVARSARHMTAVSPIIARRWLRQMAYRGAMHVVGNVVESIEPPILRTRQPVVLSVGTGSSLKNIRTLLSAFVRVRRAIPDAGLVIVGPDLAADGPMSRWAQSQGLAAGVDFTGPLMHSQVLQRMGTAAVLCHPSLEESFGMTVAEAMAAGLPVVAGESAGGVPWLLNDGAAGSLVDVRDPEQIARAIIRVLTDPDHASALLRAGRARALDFTPDAVAGDYLSTYSTVLERHSTRPTGVTA